MMMMLMLLIMMIAPCVHQVAVCPPLVLQQAACRANVADLSFSQFPLSSQFLIKVNRHHYCLFGLSGILNFHDISFKNIIVKKLPSKTSKQSSGKESNACWCSLAFIPALLFIVRCGQLPMFGILSTVQDKSSERALFDGVGSTLCSLPGFWENWPQGRNLIRQLLSGEHFWSETAVGGTVFRCMGPILLQIVILI